MCLGRGREGGGKGNENLTARGVKVKGEKTEEALILDIE